MTAPTLYLASGSPRRREILENLGYNIIRLSANIDETPYPHETPDNYVARMARKKNQAAQIKWHAENPTTAPAFPILTADTTVALNHIILGKPESIQHAHDMLQQLSGTTHSVKTAVSIHWNNQTVHHTQTSYVTFAKLSKQDIQAYIESKEPMDKAGAYGIQGLGGIFVTQLEGSFTGVMGLPIFETIQLLKSIHYPTPPFNHF